MHERNRLLCTAAFQPGIQIRVSHAQRCGVEDHRFNPLALEQLLEKERTLNFVAGRVGGVHPNVVAQVLHALALERRPIDWTGRARGLSLERCSGQQQRDGNEMTHWDRDVKESYSR